MDRLPTANDRKKLERRAQESIFELILAEPTGSRDVRQSMVERTRAFIASMRTDLYPAGQEVK